MGMIQYLLKLVTLLANQMREEPGRRKELSEEINKIYGNIQIVRNSKKWKSAQKTCAKLTEYTK